MKYPSRTRRIVEKEILPFEPSMVEILEAFRRFQDKYQATPQEVVLEETTAHSDRMCVTCGDGGCIVSAMVFSRLVPNENYDEEMKAWFDFTTRHNQTVSESYHRRTIQTESRLAREYWRKHHRDQRIAARSNPIQSSTSP